MSWSMLLAGALFLAQGALPGRGMANGRASGGMGENGLYSDQTAPGARSIDGSVTKAAPGSVTVLGAGGRQLDLVVDGRTEVTREGAKVDRRALQPGDEVRASYAVENGEAHALTIHVVQTSVPRPKNGD